VLAHLKAVLRGMGVDFDVWFSERTLHVKGADGLSEVDRGIEQLRRAGFIFELDGATWFRSTDFGDDKDRVLRKADGDFTYFAADIAYHKDKFDRGFDRVIDIWGADHHGYVARMKAAVAALGRPGKLDIVIGQLVTLLRNGEQVRMSKRTGEMVTFEELLDEVGADAARYFFLRRSTDQPLDFDIGLAKQQSSENPVFYVQYGHARICSILRKAAGIEAGTDIDVADVVARLVPTDVSLDALADPAEFALIRKLAEFPEIVEAAAVQLAPHKLPHYAEELAAAFHQFYTLCRVVTDDEALTVARLALVDATRSTLERVLALVGVSAPQSM
jgi:arginyl-tRNA synthetase